MFWAYVVRIPRLAASTAAKWRQYKLMDVGRNEETNESPEFRKLLSICRLLGNL